MSATTVIRVLTVDDHPLMRAGIAGEINAQPDMVVVAEATDGREAIESFELHRPDVTLMDLRMPNMDGVEAIVAIRAISAMARIVVLTTAAGDIQAMRAFKAGATGYLLKNMLRTDLIETIHLVYQGKRKIPQQIALQMAEHSIDDTMTPRELDVLADVARGHSNKMIAGGLNISEHTVKNHIKSILSKLGATDRTHAVIIGLKRGFLDL